MTNKTEAEIDLATDGIDALIEAITAIMGDGWQAHLVDDREPVTVH